MKKNKLEDNFKKFSLFLKNLDIDDDFLENEKKIDKKLIQQNEDIDKENKLSSGFYQKRFN